MARRLHHCSDHCAELRCRVRRRILLLARNRRICPSAKNARLRWPWWRARCGNAASQAGALDNRRQVGVGIINVVQLDPATGRCPMSIIDFIDTPPCRFFVLPILSVVSSFFGTFQAVRARSGRVRLPMFLLCAPNTTLVIDSRERRCFTLALLVSAATLGAPAVLRAQTSSGRPDALRQSKSVAEAMTLAGVVNPEPARRVLLDTPDILLAGDSVEIRVVSQMPGTDWIMLLAEGRSSPVIDVVEFTPGEGRALSAKVVLSRTTRFRAVVRSAGRYFSVTREVKVAAVGCPR